jgi:CubicO group peptidase (beta-lactamase class C family)
MVLISHRSALSRPARLSVLLLICFSLVGSRQSHAQLEPSEALAAKLGEICKKHRVPSLAAAAVNRDGLLEIAIDGVRKQGMKERVELSDRFPLGSNTKSMTGVIAAALVESGKIDWKTTISEVWPKASKDIHEAMREVTLDDLLSHQSGLPADLEGPAWAGFFNERQSPVLERRRLMKLVLSQAPSETQNKFSYSNLGYAVASAMLETRAKEPFEKLAQRILFDPLEMKSAEFRSMKSAKKMKPPFLWGHDAQGKPFDPRIAGAENPTVYAACGTVHLSIEDYAKYAQWVIKAEPASILTTQAALEHLREPLVDHASPGASYGCGWIRFTSGFGTTLQHAGSNTKAFALIWVLPDANLAAFACTNTGAPQAMAACDEAIGHLLQTHGSASPRQE